jgi:F420-dependent oxidoreductase-like protein
MKISFFSIVAGNIEGQMQAAVDAEKNGMDGIWLAQIFGADAMTFIALAGQKTSRIEMGTAVVPVYPRHPFVMAQQALTTQAASADRFTLGIGLSHKVVIEDLLGMSFRKSAEFMAEYLSVLMPLLQDGRVSFNGEFFRVNASLQVPAPKPPQVVLAAMGRKMLRLAGSVTDGTVTWMCGPKTIGTHVVPRISAAAEEAGRPKPRVIAGLPVAVVDDVAAAREKAARAFQQYGTVPSYQRMLAIEGASGPADVAIVGDEASVERDLKGLRDSGATEFLASIFPAGPDAKASVARTLALLSSLVGRI